MSYRDIHTVKVKSVYSYLRAKELSLEKIENIFLEAINNNVYDEIYKVSFDSDKLIMNDYQICATKEILNKYEVAYITQDKSVIAVIGYQKTI